MDDQPASSSHPTIGQHPEAPGSTAATGDSAGSALSTSHLPLESMIPAVSPGAEEQEPEEWAALAAAMSAAEHDLALARATGDRQREGLALVSLGNSAMLMGDGPRALGYYEQHLALTRALGDRREEGTALDTLGNAYYVLGNVARAIDCLEHELAIARELGAQDHEARVSWNLGLTLESQGEYARAATVMQQCVAYERAIDHPDAEEDADMLEQVLQKAQAKAALPESIQQAISPLNQATFMEAWAGLTREDHARLRPLLDHLGLIYERLTTPAFQAILAQLPESLRDPVVHAHEDAFLDVWATLPAAEQTRLRPLLDSIGIVVECAEDATAA